MNAVALDRGRRGLNLCGWTIVRSRWQRSNPEKAEVSTITSTDLAPDDDCLPRRPKVVECPFPKRLCRVVPPGDNCFREDDHAFRRLPRESLDALDNRQVR